MSNFKHVSHLPFLSKVLERVIFIQLQTFLETKCVSDNFQPDIKCQNSTESALLKVYNDIALSQHLHLSLWGATGFHPRPYLLYIVCATTGVRYKKF